MAAVADFQPTNEHEGMVGETRSKAKQASLALCHTSCGAAVVVPKHSCQRQTVVWRTALSIGLLGCHPLAGIGGSSDLIGRRCKRRATQLGLGGSTGVFPLLEMAPTRVVWPKSGIRVAGRDQPPVENVTSTESLTTIRTRCTVKQIV